MIHALLRLRQELALTGVSLLSRSPQKQHLFFVRREGTFEGAPKQNLGFLSLRLLTDLGISQGML